MLIMLMLMMVPVTGTAGLLFILPFLLTIEPSKGFCGEGTFVDGLGGCASCEVCNYLKPPPIGCENCPRSTTLPSALVTVEQGISSSSTASHPSDVASRTEGNKTHIVKYDGHTVIVVIAIVPAVVVTGVVLLLFAALCCRRCSKDKNSSKVSAAAIKPQSPMGDGYAKVPRDDKEGDSTSENKDHANIDNDEAQPDPEVPRRNPVLQESVRIEDEVKIGMKSNQQGSATYAVLDNTGCVHHVQTKVSRGETVT